MQIAFTGLRDQSHSVRIIEHLELVQEIVISSPHEPLQTAQVGARAPMMRLHPPFRGFVFRGSLNRSSGSHESEWHVTNRVVSCATVLERTWASGGSAHCTQLGRAGQVRQRQRLRRLLLRVRGRLLQMLLAVTRHLLKIYKISININISIDRHTRGTYCSALKFTHFVSDSISDPSSTLNPISINPMQSG